MTEKVSGDLIVSKDVLADIAAHATLQCYGVLGLAAPEITDGIAKLLPHSRLRKGVTVTPGEDGVEIDLYIILEHGVNIATVSSNLVDQVSFALKEFVQVPLKKVEVHVQGIKVR